MGNWEHRDVVSDSRTVEGSERYAGEVKCPAAAVVLPKTIARRKSDASNQTYQAATSR